MNQVELLRHVADNLEAGRPAGHGLLCNGKTVESIAFGCPGAYSLAPRTRIINGVEVPAPMDKRPEKSMRYWIEAPQFEELCDSTTCDGCRQDFRFFELGLCYESAEAAAANCRARYGIE